MRDAMLLGPLSAAFGILGNPIPRGCIELPTAYGEHLWGLMKGRPVKYVKRVPKPGGGWRYYYDVGHGGGVDSHEHMVEGARFKHGAGHFHIVKSEGDKLHVRNTTTGEEHTTTRHELAQKLAAHHAEGLKSYRDRATKALAEGKANKASPKQIARLEERVKRAGGAALDAFAALTSKQDAKPEKTDAPERELPSGGAHVTVKHKVADRDISSSGNGTQRFWKYRPPGAADFGWPDAHGMEANRRLPSGMIRKEEREASVMATGRLPVGTRVKEINQEFRRGSPHSTAYQYGTIGEWQAPDGARRTVRWDGDKALVPMNSETKAAWDEAQAEGASA